MTDSSRQLSAIRIRIAVVVLLLGTTVLGLKGANEPRRAHLSADLRAHVARHSRARTRVIVRGTKVQLEALARRHRLQIVRSMPGAAVLLADSAELTALEGDATINQLSGDPVVRTSMTVSDQSTGADQTRAGKAGLLGIGAIPGVDGSGVGVAVIDSGITPHAALTSRVVANVSFVPGDPNVTDGYGHGTHVAGIIAGSAAPAASVTPLYKGGIAPGARLVNVRVLGNDGSGYTSDVIAGIEWVIAHKGQYNIRVINLSLGHPVMESCATDPLCQEIGRAVQAGIVVVASAGNYGKSSTGGTVLGSIASPGNSPDAITVGALNTWSTAARNDDTVATFSSRGPTAYDGAVKPDVAAPGVKIISLQANNALLPTLYSNIHTAGTGNNAYMYLSGTSMAAPIVTGGVALLLDGNPGLSPAQVKMALQTGATYMEEAGLMAAGAGSVNFWASRQAVVDNSGSGGGLLSSLVSTVIGGLTADPSGMAFWDLGTMSGSLYAGTAVRQLSSSEASNAWNNPALLQAGRLNLFGSANLVSSLTPKWIQFGELAGFTDDESILWGTSMQDVDGQSILWGTSDEESILWGTATSPTAQ
jgi:serine protease AprX